jgi:hypothetical protein
MDNHRYIEYCVFVLVNSSFMHVVDDASIINPVVPHPCRKLDSESQE